MSFDKESLDYHEFPVPGKVDVQSSKPCSSERHLSLAYSPGVAEPCRRIAANPQDVFKYTTKGNLVAVVTNGTAVLGLGNLGPLASKPVMEGKGVLFKQFAGINVFDLELNVSTVDEFVATCKALEPTFGGINLEDIKAPDCFEIERRLKEEMNIPVFHDDQHGTAIISGAALINACLLTKRKVQNVKMVINGAGAAAVACARLFVQLGVKRDNVIMCDSKGVIYKGRTEGMNPYKEEFAVNTPLRTLREAMEGADCFVGLSVAGAVTEEMVASMAKNPIIFAMANPDPEISPLVVEKIRPDAIMATGRTDYPNQVNNVLGFPSIFRGALDCSATQINEEMKLAAVEALARLARAEVHEKVAQAYGGKTFAFGPDYIIPKPFDPRVLLWVAPAVAEAAAKSGVALRPIEDLDTYRDSLESLQGARATFIRSIVNRIKTQALTQHKSKLPRIVFPEGTSDKVLKAVNLALDEEILEPILLGNPEKVQGLAESLQLESLLKHLKNNPAIQPDSDSRYQKFAQTLYEKRQRKGVMYREAERLMKDSNYFGAMAVHLGEADGLVTGATIKYADAVKPMLQVIGTGKRKTASGVNLVLFKDKILYFADTAVNPDPTAQQLAHIAIHTSSIAEYFKQTPRIAMLSYSNFTARPGTPLKMKQAAELVREERPDLMVDGEMQADTAVNPRIKERIFPFSALDGGANILIFPNLDAGNIAYKLVQQLGGGEVVGPFLLGVKKPANIVQRTGNVDDVYNSIVLTALQCQAMLERNFKTTLR